MAATIRAAPSVLGKSSRVTPMKVRTSAQIASAMPQKWKAFTAAKATGIGGGFTRKSPADGRRVRTYVAMAPLLDSIISVMGSPRGRRPICLVCGRSITKGQELMRLRGEMVVHRRCATYDMRRRREGVERLGYPRAR
jgi:hypothetical protein